LILDELDLAGDPYNLVCSIQAGTACDISDVWVLALSVEIQGLP
jgi:hypothetical protein